MRLKEVAQATGLSEETIRRLDRRGVIRAKRDANGARIFDPSMVSFLRQRYGKEIVHSEVSHPVPNDAGELLFPESEPPAWRIEPIGMCGHLFGEHARAGDGHAHACLQCECGGWCGHSVCVQCGARLDGCAVTDAKMFSLRQARYIWVIVSVCKDDPQPIVFMARELNAALR